MKLQCSYARDNQIIEITLGSGAQLSGKILVIDDSQDVRNMLSLMFKLEGYDVVQACSGRQALLKLKNESLPKLIFLDYLMD
jgi:CheY-like chemotaxis protein